MFLAPGCRHGDRVESELRSREREVRELREHMDHIEGYNEALQREMCELRRRPATGVREATPPTGVRESSPAELIPIPPKSSRSESSHPGVLENVTLPSTIKEIVLGRATGGLDEDHYPGDDALQVVLEPRDVDGHSLKVPGCLHVTVLEILPEGIKKPLSTWEVSGDGLRRTWKSGLFSTGYCVVLPWKCWPSVEKLRVVVQFQLADGRLFESDKDITIRLPPAAYRKPPVVDPEPEPTLLLPHKVEKRVQPISWQEAPPASGVRLLRPVVE